LKLRASISCRYQGIGIRIEDEVLITATGYEVNVTLEACQLAIVIVEFLELCLE